MKIQNHLSDKDVLYVKIQNHPSDKDVLRVKIQNHLNDKAFLWIGYPIDFSGRPFSRIKHSIDFSDKAVLRIKWRETAKIRRNHDVIDVVNTVFDVIKYIWLSFLLFSLLNKSLYVLRKFVRKSFDYEVVQLSVLEISARLLRFRGGETFSG